MFFFNFFYRIGIKEIFDRKILFQVFEDIEFLVGLFFFLVRSFFDGVFYRECLDFFEGKLCRQRVWRFEYFVLFYFLINGLFIFSITYLL